MHLSRWELELDWGYRRGKDRLMGSGVGINGVLWSQGGKTVELRDLQKEGVEDRKGGTEILTGCRGRRISRFRH
jgi:hypothetical protein